MFPIKISVFCCGCFHFYFYFYLDENENGDEESQLAVPPFPVFQAPTEQELLQHWQELCIDVGIDVEDIVITHTSYPFSHLKHFQSKNLLTFYKKTNKKWKKWTFVNFFAFLAFFFFRRIAFLVPFSATYSIRASQGFPHRLFRFH